MQHLVGASTHLLSHGIDVPNCHQHLLATGILLLHGQIHLATHLQNILGHIVDSAKLLLNRSSSLGKGGDVTTQAFQCGGNGLTLHTGLLCQLADFVSNDSKALSRLTGMGGLNGGVHGQKVCLAGDMLDDSRCLHQAAGSITDFSRNLGGICNGIPSLCSSRGQGLNLIVTAIQCLGYCGDIRHHLLNRR